MSICPRQPHRRAKEISLLALLVAHLFLTSVSYAQTRKVSFTQSLEDFANPERGFYLAVGGKPGTLSSEELVKLRTLPAGQKINNSAEYSAKLSLVYRGYLLADFRTSPLSAEFLENLRKDFAATRKAGMKMILRFAYTNDTKAGDCKDDYKICPPYGDASKAIVLQHIAQLKPVFQENADVIAVLQQGFIGIWGENYFTDYFGDASTNGLGVVADSSWQDRNDMLKALLNALPENRMVQVRTPQIKQRFVHGPKAPVTASALTQEEAFSKSDYARVGLHNDCFLASEDDYGTFYDYGNSSSKRGPANEVLRKYFEDESRYVAVGGETCDDAFSPQNDCAPAGHAEQEMAAMHYSYLNSSYNNQVNNDWISGGCMDNIKRRLGYRFTLKSASFPEKAKKGKGLPVTLNLENVGFAAPFNPRPVQLVLRNKKTGQLHALPLATEIRKWFPGQVTVSEELMLPANLPKGEYDLLLNLPDSYESLAKRPEYSIRLANNDVWEGSTGFNRLNHTIKVN
ncbi:DUF4832 domain-containing protein [Rufibacter sediminis]|uniref:DUF4832 domain-containing protein n=1 Tax=Rufibacter sediminis TaxID=2762756 RepID=A0ABR6VY16_9BACT|nr:DUF4832 domain-containing protein [Rufibacter sediminis]MBC3541993.1 DUF4832 domain-containing protein [Rufibacter sediminis]